MGQVTSVFLYVDNIEKSIEFYYDIVGAQVVQVFREDQNSPISLAILKIRQLHLDAPTRKRPHAADFENAWVGLGIHLQLKVDDVDAFFTHCVDEGAIISTSGEPTDQAWGWREFALKDPDGYVWSIYQDKSNGQWT